METKGTKGTKEARVRKEAREAKEGESSKGGAARSRWNLPNRLTMIRIALAPPVMLLLMLPESVIPFSEARVLACLLFILASITDMLDGKIARKYKLITDFGKFMDPIADKIMVFAALICITVRCTEIQLLFLIATSVVVFREFTVTSMRLIMANKNTVIAANMLGKIKTVMQIVCICAALLEPVIYQLASSLFADGATLPIMNILPLTYFSTILMIIFTVWSGINYIAAYWKYLDPTK